VWHLCPRWPDRDPSWCVPTFVAILPIADVIQQETGQVGTKNAVIGKMYRLRAAKARAELEEDLAKD
jgi:hypothetical protein